VAKSAALPPTVLCCSRHWSLCARLRLTLLGLARHQPRDHVTRPASSAPETADRSPDRADRCASSVCCAERVACGGLASGTSSGSTLDGADMSRRRLSGFRMTNRRDPDRDSRSRTPLSGARRLVLELVRVDAD
jgi:hypothetical protein